MRKILIIILSIFCSYAYAQSPVLTAKGEDSSKVRMSQLLVSVKIVGNIAHTTAEMHFLNSGSRQMEAELLFPLPEGVSVSRYAIDINGKIREAVPVNKNKGKQVFEAVEHRRVDPGLLEKVEGNNFRTRIYPLMPNAERIVIIGYEQELAALDKNNLAYRLVSKYGKPIDKFEINIAVLGNTSTPTITDENNPENLNWTASSQTSIKKVNYQPSEKILIKIPIKQDAASVVVQTVLDQYYFYTNTIIDNKKIEKKLPESIGLVWDNSLSCKNRDVKKEIALLDTYFKKIKNTKVTLYSLNYFFKKEEIFVVANGDWASLKNKLENSIYDGGTRFSQINFGLQDEFLFFTDGLSSLSENKLPATKSPIYTISSSASSDFAFLNFTALQTGANFINLNQLNDEQALNKLLFQSIRFLGIKENTFVTEMYPMVGTQVSGSFSSAGISLKPINEITLLFGYSNVPTIEKIIKINAEINNSDDVNIEKLWAQKKIANLELNYKKNAEEIETVGKQYGIVTQGTSLIVLEDINDYIAYEIVPPAELRAEYDKIIKEQGQTTLAQKKNNWNSVGNYFDELFGWWKKDIRYHVVRPMPISKKRKGGGKEVGEIYYANGLTANGNTSYQFSTNNAQSFSVSSNTLPASAISQLSTNSRTYKTDAIVNEKTISTQTLYDEKDKSTDNENMMEWKNDDGNKVINKTEEPSQNRFADSLTQQIKTSSWSPDRLYLKLMAKATAEKKYETYLQLRETQITNPTFYYDMANYFYDKGDKEKALLVLSNIADLGLENHQLYKTLTYTLRQWQAYEDALHTAKKIVEWRTHEPQSHRDYALTLEDNKQYQAAFDELINALEVNYFGEMGGHYDGIEDIILMDINRMITEHPSIKTGKLPKKYLKKMPVGVRIILNWNQMDVDLDMHVIEPNKEECYYSHTSTEAGARFSKDFTQGYGPEQYLIRNAIRGKYLVKTNYFGETTLTESGPATVMVEIYIQKANGTIERRLKTIQIGKVKENQNLATINIE
jgi:hypothetical protein